MLVSAISHHPHGVVSLAVDSQNIFVWILLCAAVAIFAVILVIIIMCLMKKKSRRSSMYDDDSNDTGRDNSEPFTSSGLLTGCGRVRIVY